MEDVLVLPMEYTMPMREDTRMVLTKETDQHIKKTKHIEVSKNKVRVYPSATITWRTGWSSPWRTP